MSATAQLENVQYYGVSFENNFLAAPRPNLTLNDMLNKKLYGQNDATAPNLAANATVLFKLCSQLIITLTYHASKQ